MVRILIFLFFITSGFAQDFQSIKKEILNFSKKKIAKPKENKLLYEFESFQAQKESMLFIMQKGRKGAWLNHTLKKELQNCKQLFESIKNKKVIETEGLREEGYFCEIDGSYQPYVRYIPEGLLKYKNFPVVVFLHGYSLRYNRYNHRILEPSLIHFAKKAGVALLLPFGRSNTDFQGIGEEDVLKAIERFKNRYSVDSRRISLLGVSMGGMGALYIAAKNPQLFNGLGLISYRGDYSVWHGLELGSLPLYKQYWIKKNFGSTYLENLVSMPIISYHGEVDRLIPIKEPQYIINKLKTFSHENLTTKVIKKGDHWIYPDVFLNNSFSNWFKRLRQKSEKSNEVVVKLPYFPLSISDTYRKPFLYVNCETPNSEFFKTELSKWYRFSKNTPRNKHISELTRIDEKEYQLHLFSSDGKHERIIDLLKNSPISLKERGFIFRNKNYALNEYGLKIMFFNTETGKNTIVHLGVPYGLHGEANHCYDALPGFMIYKNNRGEKEPHGMNEVIAGGFLDKNKKIISSSFFFKE